MALSSSADPYYLAQSEVQSGVNSIRSILEKWSRLVSESKSVQSGEYSKLADDARFELQNTEQDLTDLAISVKIAEENPTRFSIDQRELERRKLFVTQTQNFVQESREKIGVLEQKKRQPKKRWDEEAESNREYVQHTRQEQKLIVAEQDEQLVALADTTHRLNETALIINRELEDQQIMIKELDDDIDREADKLNFVSKRMAVLLKTNDGKALYLVMVLCAVFLGLLGLLVFT
eukprot:Platyproteum_vivax@DN4105_c0_g1_i2.p1